MATGRRPCVDEVAARLRSMRPGSRFVGRLGGDEFALLMIDAQST